jgi:hypothetical protein
MQQICYLARFAVPKSVRFRWLFDSLGTLICDQATYDGTYYPENAQFFPFG